MISYLIAETKKTVNILSAAQGQLSTILSVIRPIHISKLFFFFHYRAISLSNFRDSDNMTLRFEECVAVWTRRSEEWGWVVGGGGGRRQVWGWPGEGRGPFFLFFFFYQNLKQARETCGLRFWSSPFQSGIILENNDIWSCYVLREGMSQLHAVVVLCWGRSTAWWSGQVSEVYGNTAVVQLAKRTLSFLFWGIKMSRIKSAQFMLYPSSLLSILTVNDEHVSVPEILSTMRSVPRAAAWSTRPASLAVQLEARHSIQSRPDLKKDNLLAVREIIQSINMWPFYFISCMN